MTSDEGSWPKSGHGENLCGWWYGGEGRGEGVSASAFAGRETMNRAYAHAIEDGYRFYSYGDASLLWRAGP